MNAITIQLVYNARSGSRSIGKEKIKQEIKGRTTRKEDTSKTRQASEWKFSDRDHDVQVD